MACFRTLCRNSRFRPLEFLSFRWLVTRLRRWSVVSLGPIVRRSSLIGCGDRILFFLPYIVPHHGNHHDTYHYHGGRYYYTPRTASVGTTRVVSKPVVVQFGSFSHVDDLASRLEELTNQFLLDLHYNYQHNHGFRETYAEGYQLMQVAKFIHDAEHAHDRAAIRSKLNGMDALFHHLQDDVRGWSRIHHRQIGQLGILSKMDMIESTLHHLMNDVGVEQAPPPAAVNGQAPPPAGTGAPLTTAPPPPSLP